MKYRNTEVKNDSLGCIMDEFSIQKKEFRYIYVKKIIKEPNRVLKLMGECYGIKITPHRLYGVEFTIELEKNIDLEYVIECKESEFLNVAPFTRILDSPLDHQSSNFSLSLRSYCRIC